MSKYAGYLDSRIRAWRELKHDLVKVQADSNKRSDGLGAACTSTSHEPWEGADEKAKARRLRHLPVEKGLLREVQQVQKVLDALLLCKVGIFDVFFSAVPIPRSWLSSLDRR